MRSLLAALLVLLGSCGSPLVTLGPDLKMTAAAWRTADSTYHAGWLKRQERALCITGWIVRDGTVVVSRFRAPLVVRSDSVTVEHIGCLGPILHTHLIENGMRWKPSPQDSLTLRMRGDPFHILMSDSHTFTVYRREQRR